MALFALYIHSVKQELGFTKELGFTNVVVLEREENDGFYYERDRRY